MAASDARDHSFPALYRSKLGEICRHASGSSKWRRPDLQNTTPRGSKCREHGSLSRAKSARHRDTIRWSHPRSYCACLLLDGFDNMHCTRFRRHPRVPRSSNLVPVLVASALQIRSHLLPVHELVKSICCWLTSTCVRRRRSRRPCGQVSFETKRRGHY